MQGQERARCLATAEELCRIAGELNLLAELQADLSHVFQFPTPIPEKDWFSRCMAARRNTRYIAAYGGLESALINPLYSNFGNNARLRMVSQDNKSSTEEIIAANYGQLFQDGFMRLTHSSSKLLSPLSCLGTEEDRWQYMAATSRRFLQQARRDAAIIVSELHQKNKNKTFTPMTLPVNTNRQKQAYQNNGIKYKLTQDPELSPGRYLYGGDTEAYDLAAKVKPCLPLSCVTPATLLSHMNRQYYSLVSMATVLSSSGRLLCS